MQYFIIEIPIIKDQNFSIAEFDKEKFKKDNGLTVIDDPILITKENNKLVIVCKGNKRKVKSGIFDKL